MSPAAHRRKGTRHWLGRLSDYREPTLGEPAKYPPDIDVAAIPLLPKAGWRLHPVEEMQIGGAAPKDYLVFGGLDDPQAPAYIAKKPGKYGYRECVTEQMISRIGQTLPLKLAASALVRLPTSGREPDVRFLSRSFLIRGRTQLKHGVELVADYVGASQSELNDVFNLGNKEAESRFYTLETVVCVLEWWARNDEERRGLLERFGRMLAFDAIVGAPDRHAENWGVIEHPGSPDVRRVLAPVYDTARGLFVDHREHKFLQIEARGRLEEHVQSYAAKSRPVFGCADGPGKPNHFDLIRYALRRYRSTLRGPVSQMLTAYRSERIEPMLQQEFGRLISPLRMKYVTALLRYRVATLRRILEEMRAS
ncbi:MAG TPA: HipA domain-containing protein [Anaeromyxobacter sp.]